LASKRKIVRASSSIRDILPSRSVVSRKGENGRVLVLGGSIDYYGAPVLTGASALRAGCDLVYLLVPRPIHQVVASYLPDFIVRSYEGGRFSARSMGEVTAFMDRADVLVAGNGFSSSSVVRSGVKKLLDKWEKPIVLDADALIPYFEYASGDVVLTPHAGEFERLFNARPSDDLDERASQVLEFAEKSGATILLKGPVDVVSDGKRVAFSETGNAGMTVGGTGDVLAGVVGAFVSQGASTFDAALAAAFMVGSAGDMAYSEYGFSFISSDLLGFLPLVLKER